MSDLTDRGALPSELQKQSKYFYFKRGLTDRTRTDGDDFDVSVIIKVNFPLR